MNGTTILHYKIGERLGAGGMGEVYLAEDTRLGRRVALKFLPASYEYDPERRERFFKEARAASALRSPNIAAIYDIGEFEGASFIVMEYVAGELLSRRIERGPLPVCETIDVSMQVADALDEAHSLGIIHRDIKSANLIITERGLVKVLDFGLAKFITGPLSAKGDAAGPSGQDTDPTFRLGMETVAGMVMGTISYMSPEQALGKTVDHRSDIFSLGIVTYEMVTGRKPFEGDSSTEVMDRIIHQEPVAIARFNYSVPHELERILRKALEKNPDFRYQSTREMFIDLRNLRRDLEAGKRTGNMNSYPTEYQPAMTASGGSRPHTGEGVAPGHSGAQTARLENAVAVLTFANITKEPSDDWIGSGIAETVSADLQSIRGLSVIGRETIFETLRHMGSGQLGEFDEKFGIDIGRRLGASRIIGGGYQRIGEMIRITARFVDVGTGALVKTVKIDGRITEIFDLQDKIVYELTQGLNLQLGNSEIKEIERDETRSVEAYENYSRGMLNLRTGSRDSLDRAIYMFEKAVELDPNYARAWAALGGAYDLKGSFASLPDLVHKGIELIQKSIALNPNISQAHEWLGGAYNAIGKYDEAMEAIRESLRIDPKNAAAHQALARVQWMGFGSIENGIRELEQAVALNPQLGYAFLQLAFLYTIVGEYDKATGAAKEAIDLQEKFISGKEGLQIVGAHTRLGYVYYRQGRYDDAIREYNTEMDFLMSSDHALRERTMIELDQKLGAAYLKKGMAEEAEGRFKRAVKKFEDRISKGAVDPPTMYYIACLYSLRGEADPAIKYLRESMEGFEKINRLRAKTDPDFDPVRDDPRFVELISS
ncbi:MAG TPA: protein kinase [Blastocatellia bacterium]|nr:protein kinase [Blastocatellia bacterium]